MNPQWLELPLSRTNFHGPKGVRAIEVRLYCERIDGLGSYFAYILLLTILSLALSHDIFRQFSAELLFMF